MKTEGKLGKTTWDELAIILSRETGMIGGENKWRKHYARIKRMFNVPVIPECSDSTSPEIVSRYIEMESKRTQLRDERQAYRRQIAESARYESILDLFREEIAKAEPPALYNTFTSNSSGKKMIAMLSDIHYGMTFKGNNPYDRNRSYDSVRAQERVMKYAYEIIGIAHESRIHECYVPLMGDLISGNIHTTLRIENRENIVQQIVGVSELISEFLRILANYFERVTVFNVPGNHSRMDMKDMCMNGERLDCLPIWYAQAKLSNFDNVEFCMGDTDPTMAVFDVCGKTYVAVHGDYDSDPVKATHRIMDIIGKKIECLLTAHMHVFETRFDECKMVRNGSILGSGDEYTQKLRLKSDPYQVVLVCDDMGISSIHPVSLT